MRIEGEDGRTQAGEGRGPSPGALARVAGDSRSRPVGIALAGLGLVLLAAVLLGLRGCGAEGRGGGMLGLGGQVPDLTGQWDVAVTPPASGVTGVGAISLSEDKEGRLTGTGEVTFPDETLAMSLQGSVAEQDSGQPSVNLRSTDGAYQMQGTLGEEGGSMEGSAAWANAEASGSFSAVRSSGAAAAPGTDERRRQVREAVAEYLEAREFDGKMNSEEHLGRIADTVVGPAYWGSPAGAEAREFAGQGQDRQGGEGTTWELGLVDFVVHGEAPRSASGTIRYRQDHVQGGKKGTFHGAVEARVARWGSGWRVLWAGESFQDLAADDLSGAWRGELDQAPPGTSREFGLELEQTTDEDLDFARLDGTLTATVYGGERAGELHEWSPVPSAEGESSVTGDGSLEISAGIDAPGSIVDFGEYDLTGTLGSGADNMTGDAVVLTCDGSDPTSCETVETTFVAERVD